MTPSAQFRTGFLMGLVSYVWWGLIPLYFMQVKSVPADQILAHRIVWSCPLMLMIVLCSTGGWSKLVSVLSSCKLVLTLLLSASFLAVNWLLYIFATVNNRVAEASLGYYMLPLANAFLATIFLGERLRPAHYPALGLILIGVSIPLINSGDFPWLALALPITFGLYGLVRKKVAVDSATGLTVETLLMLVPSVGFLAWEAIRGRGAFGVTMTQDIWLIASGVATVVPLLSYTISIRLLPLITQAFIQFVSPTVQFLLAIVLFHEAMGIDRWAAMICVWIAVLIFIADAFFHWRAVRRKHDAGLVVNVPAMAAVHDEREDN